MVVLVPTKFAVLLAAACALAGGCASGPNLPRALAIEAGRRTTVRMMQFSTGQVFSLQNASSGSADDVYSDKRADPLAKVIPDEQLQKLLDVLAEKGAFQGTSTVPPDARDALIVQQDEKRWAFYRRQAGLQQEELAFHEAKAYFLSVWNGATAYHTTDPDTTDLKAAQDKAKADAQAMKRKLESGSRQ